VFVNQSVEVFEYFYPFAESINKKLLDEAKLIEYSESYKTNLECKMSSWETKTKNSKIISQWVSSLLYTKHEPWKYSFQIDKLWYAKYDYGDFAHPHTHIPFSFAFVYFINTPKGSSPLCFSRKSIKAESGKLVIFPACLKHHVPKNKCENRLIMAGNVSLQRVST